MASNKKYPDNSGAVPLIAIAMVAAIPVVGLFMENPDKEEFSQDVAMNGPNLEKRVEFVRKGYSAETACELEVGSIAESFLIEAGGKQLYIEQCVDETTQIIVASGPVAAVRG